MAQLFKRDLFMTIKTLMIATLLIILSGCSISYSESMTTHRSFRVVSIQQTPEPKADLLDMTNFQMYYNQPLSERCASSLAVGDHLLMNKVVVKVAGVTSVRLENMNKDDEFCVKATQLQIDSVGTAFDLN